MRIALADYGDVKLTPETLRICSAVYTEFGFPDENIDYVHLDRSTDAEKVKGYDLVLALGAEATSVLCQTSIPLKKYAGSLTWNDDLGAWILPTMHPNRIYQEAYGDFDVAYDAMKRSVDLCTGRLEFPSRDGVKLDWEFIGHNGLRGDDPSKYVYGPRLPEGYGPNIWSGYFEYTDEEVRRQKMILSTWIARLDQGEERLGIDTESYTTDHFQPMTMIQVYDGIWAYAFNWGVIEQNLPLWQEFVNHPNARFDWHNKKHDDKMVRHHMGVRLDERHNCTLAWALGLTEKGNQTGLKYLSRQYCNAGFYEESLDEWLDRSENGKHVNFGHIRPDVLAEYGCHDVYYGYKLSPILRDLVEREGTTRLVEDILLPATHTFAELEYEGILVDQDLGHQLSADWSPRIDAAIEEVQTYAAQHGFPRDPDIVKSQVYREYCECVHPLWKPALEGARVLQYRKIIREKFGVDNPCRVCNRRRYVRKTDYTLNVRSSTHMQHLCFDVLGMEQTWEGRKCNKYFWEINQAHEFAQLVAAYRELDYLHRNIVKGFAKFIREDGRVHPDFLLFGTTTGRLAVRNPAMQTVPSRSLTAKPVKRLFLPDTGDLLVNVDYSNLELYVAHHLTGDQNLLEALERDMHQTTAAAMYMKLYEEVTAEERQSAKPVNFGAGYNIKANKLSKDKNLIKITGGQKGKAQKFLDDFWGLYSVWDSCRKQWVKDAFDNCSLRTELGRKRRWNLITKDNSWKVENQACNFQGQSMASDLCLTSLIQLQKELTQRRWGRVMMSVHDSIVFSVHPETLHEAVELIEQTMTTPVFPTETPFKVDVTVGVNYGDQDPYDPEGVYV